MSPIVFSEQRKQDDQNSSEADPDSKCNSAELLEGVLSSNTNKEEKSKFGFPQNNNYNIADYQSLVKALVWGVKTITWGCAACRVSYFIHFDSSFDDKWIFADFFWATSDSGQTFSTTRDFSFHTVGQMGSEGFGYIYLERRSSA